MQEAPRHRSQETFKAGPWVVMLLLVGCLSAVAWAAPQVLADGESAVRLLAFLIDLARIAL